MKQNFFSMTGNFSTKFLVKTSVKIARMLPFACFMITACILILSAQNGYGQTTINTTIGSTGYNGSNSSGTNGFITFVVANNSGVPMKITRVGNWATTSHNNTTSTLWYSSTSLSGSVTLSTPTWTSIASNVVTGVTGSGVYAVLPTVNFQIPNGAVYRFAVHTTGTNNYTLGTPTPNNFTAAGVTLYTGNHQIAGKNVGYAVGNNPRYFSGFITFEPAFTGVNNAGVSEIVSPVPLFCNGAQQLKVKVKNGGVNAINSVVVKWLLDGFPQTDVVWNTTIPIGGSADVTLSNSVVFGAAARNIKAWTTLPNGGVDTVNTDDTLNTIMRSGLNGIYVVGPTGDFTTVQDAADALTNFGVCGPVTMDITNGTYNAPVKLGNVQGTSSVNRITFKSQSGNPANVVIAASPTGTGFVFQNAASYVTIKNVTIQSNSVNEGRVLEFLGSASYDSVLNCTINSSGVTSSSNSAGIYGSTLTGSNNTFLDNRINRGYYAIYWEGKGTAAADLTQNNIFDRNTITDAYVYSSYFYYTSNLKFRNNTIRAINSPTTHYGLYGYYNDNSLEVINNDIVITGSGQKSGIYMYYSDGTASKLGIILNNTIAIDCGTSTAYGIYNYYSSYQNFINNSVSVNSTSTSTNAGKFYYSSTSYRFNNIVNNVFADLTGSGYTMYLYSTSSTYNNYWDYNNIYSGSNKIGELGSPAGTYSTLSSWVAATNQNANSISYDPGFTGITDLHPDVNNPASWSLNGRGLHIAGNNLDVDNNSRIELVTDGAPDLGAYEFTPLSIPPLATATPATAVQGSPQVFTFGQREIATVNWGNDAPVAELEMRQYSGVRAPGIVAAASPFGSMYFHTDVKATGSNTSFDIDLDINYMDIWLGTIASENNLKLAQNVPGYSWMVYNGTLSTNNTSSNTIHAPELALFGSFTGLEDGSIPSAFVKPQGKTIICIGDNVQLKAEPQNGDFYKWYLNGQEILGASGPAYTSYKATMPGDYKVAITYSGKIVESVPVAISTISVPNAVISANGPLTYCVGNGLTLDAGNVTGVSYKWQLNGVDIPGAIGNTYQVNQAGDYTVQVENIACASVSTPTPVKAGPLHVYLGNDTSYCEIKNVFAKLDAGYPGATYLWSTGETTQTIEVKQSGKYSVHVDGGPNCVADDDIMVNIDPLPKANGISFVKQNANTYQFFPSGPVGAVGFLWIFSDGTTTTVNNPVKSITGDLYVRLVMFNACGADTVQLGWPLTVNTVADMGTLEIYPNPANDLLNIRNNKAIGDIAVINTIGSVVSRVNGISAKEYAVNVAALPAGNYILQVNSGDAVTTRQFSIVR